MEVLQSSRVSQGQEQGLALYLHERIEYRTYRMVEWRTKQITSAFRSGKSWAFSCSQGCQPWNVMVLSCETDGS